MRVRELYNQLAHDIKAHGDLQFVVEIKYPDGNVIRHTFVADRYVSTEEVPKYVLRMVPLKDWLDE